MSMLLKGNLRMPKSHQKSHHLQAGRRNPHPQQHTVVLWPWPSLPHSCTPSSIFEPPVQLACWCEGLPSLFFLSIPKNLGCSRNMFDCLSFMARDMLANLYDIV